MELTFLLVVFLCFPSDAANITQAPSSVTAPLYTLATFTCEGTGEEMFWTVGGNSPDDHNNEDREISVTINNISVDVWSSVLTVRALPINDRISVGCTVIDFIPYDKDQIGAILTIEGVSPVNNLTFYNSILMNNFLLTWSPPSFYSDDIPQGSIATYHVYVKSQDGSVIVDVNTTDTFYLLPSNLIVNCNFYYVSVKAFVEQYSSPATNITKENTDLCCAIDVLSHDVKFNNSGNSSIIQVQFTINIKDFTYLCDDIIYGKTKDNVNNETILYDPVYINSTVLNETTIFYNITGLHPSLNYTFTAYIMDLFNNTKNEDHVIFTTYHVQRLNLQYCSNNESVIVECRFAERSTADGCHVIFREFSKGTMKSINMTKSCIEETTVYQYITLPVSGNYTVTAHDIVDGTIITNPSIVYPQVIEYIILLSSSTETVINISTASNDMVVRVTTETTVITTTNIITSIEPTSGISNFLENLNLITGILAGIFSVVILLIITGIIICVCYCWRGKKKSKNLNKEPTSQDTHQI